MSDLTTSAKGATRDATAATLWLRVGLPGLLASAVMAVGALGVGWVAPASELATGPVLGAARESLIGSVLFKLVLIVGVGWLLRTWLTTARLSYGLDVTGARRLGAMALVWSVPLVAAPVLFSRDVFSYIALSRLAPAGIDPYEHGTGALPSFWADGADPLWMDAPTPYGPLWMTLSSVTYHLTEAEPALALLAFRLLALAGVALLVVLVPRLAQLAGTDPGQATWLIVANPLVIFHFVSSGHNDALMVGLLVAGLVIALHNRLVLAVVLVSAAGAIKAPALLALPFLGLLWAGPTASWFARIRAWVRVAVLSVASFAGFTLASGLGTGWLGNLSTPATVDTWLSPVTAVGRTLGEGVQLLGGPDAETVLALTRALGLVATAGIVAWLLLTGQRRPVLHGLAAAMLTLIALGPVIQPWYLLWALPLVAVLDLTRTQVRIVVGGTIGMSVYSVANTAATVDSIATLPDGIAAVLAVAIIAGMLAHRRASGTPSSPWAPLKDQTAVADAAVSRTGPAAISGTGSWVVRRPRQEHTDG